MIRFRKIDFRETRSEIYRIESLVEMKFYMNYINIFK